MKKRILLIDESLTVQKVVALTLDKNRYSLYYAKSRNEALKQWSENPPELILVGDQVPDINISSFPKEMEVWVGKGIAVPPMILISGHDARDQKNYAGVLKKPFAPSALQAMVSDILSNQVGASETDSSPDEFEDQRLQKIFNDTFPDESTLVRETFRTDTEAEAEAENGDAEQTPIPEFEKAVRSNPWSNATVEKLWSDSPQTTPSSGPAKKSSEDLWSPAAQVTTPKNSHAPQLEQELTERLSSAELSEIVDRVLNRIVPPIVERLVQERLDKLLKAQEEFVELKP
jgi:CheY-like chemotaxis protein